MNRSSIVTLVLLVVVIAMITAGCTTLTGGTAQKSISTAPQDIAWESNSGSGGGGGGGGGGGIAQGAYRPMPTPVPTFAPGSSVNPDPAGQGGVIDQKLIYTAQVGLEVTDIPASVDSLKALADGKGGYTASSNFNTQSNNRQTATVVLRVPANEFDNTLTGVKAIGTVKLVSTNSEDVSAEYVDIQAQKASYQNQIAQYNEIMKKSEKVEDIINVQGQIDRLQTSLDRLEGRMRYLNNRIDFSTITVNLAQPEPVGGGTGYSFVSTINEGISGLVGMIDFLIVALFTLLPVIIIGAAGYVVYRWHQSKKSREKPVPPKPETPEKK